MRTVTSNFYKRLQAQKEEAELLKLKKVSENINGILTKYANAQRDPAADYSYASVELEDDVQKTLWDAIVRVADFYGTHIDAAETQGLIEKISQDLIEEVRVKSGATIGVYEPGLPGETKQMVVIEVEQNQ